MNSKLFILVVIAVTLNVVYGQLIARRARVAAPAWGGVVGGARVWGSHLGVAAPAYGYGLGYGALGYGGLGYGIGHGHYGVARVAAPAAIGIAAPAVSVAAPAYGVAHGIGYGGLGLGRVAGLGLGLGLRHGVGVSQHIGPVTAAIETVRTHQVVDVPTSQDVITPTNLIVEPNILPVNIEFRSQSSPVNVNQVHIPGRPAEVQHTNSEEPADRLVHEVVKPVVQEVRETIVPFRRITQEVLPVQEEVHSLVARGQRQQVLAAPQVVAQPVAARVAVAAPAVAVARPAIAAVAAPVATGLVGSGIGVVGQAFHPTAVVGHNDLVTTGIARFGGAFNGFGGTLNGIGGVIPIRARS